jgi:hypothetical protein
MLNVQAMNVGGMCVGTLFAILCTLVCLSTLFVNSSQDILVVQKTIFVDYIEEIKEFQKMDLRR